MSEGSVDIKNLVKTYVDDRGRPTFTAVKNISYTSRMASSWCLLDLPDAESQRRSVWSPALRKSRAEPFSIGDRVVNELEPKDRGVAMVFQNYALYPHMTLFNNMAGLKQTGPVGD